MNWYKHYIGDFQRDTGHLTLSQVGAYRALIDHYYATEEPLPMDRASLYRICRAHTQSEQLAVTIAVGFFSEFNGRYHHDRIDREIQKASAQSQSNRIAAVEREAKKRAERELDESTNRGLNVVDLCQERGTKRAPTRLPDLKEKACVAEGGI